MLKIRPENFEDVVALNALYRPGPIRNIDEFTARRHGRKTVSYPAKVLEPILNSTYGIIVYQEQAMQVSSKMGGFTLGEADILRQAISKKEHETIERMRVKFVAGAQKRVSQKKTHCEFTITLNDLENTASIVRTPLRIRRWLFRWLTLRHITRQNFIVRCLVP